MKKSPVIHFLSTLPLAFCCQWSQMGFADETIPVIRGGETILMTNAEWARLKLRKGYQRGLSPIPRIAPAFRSSESREALPPISRKATEPEVAIAPFPKGIGHRPVVIPVVLLIEDDARPGVQMTVLRHKLRFAPLASLGPLLDAGKDPVGGFGFKVKAQLRWSIAKWTARTTCSKCALINLNK